MTFLVCAACNRHSDVSAEIARIKMEAQVAHPNDPLSEAKKVNEDLFRLAVPLTANNKPQLAAAVFLGYYRKNVYVLPTLCQEQGVALQAFTRSFISVNKPWFDAASKFPNMPLVDAQVVARSFYEARAELAKVAERRKISLGDTCAMLEENAETVAERMKFSAIAPELHEQLLGKQ
jgi:hypothetical protein